MTESDNFKPTKKRGPEWAVAPFGEFLDRTEQLERLRHLSMRGIATLRGMPNIVTALAEFDGDDSRVTTGTIERAKEEAELAERECSTGFPVLHEQFTVALWSSLEASIRLFLANWLQHYPDAMTSEAVQKLRVRLGEYESLVGDDRYFYIVDRLEQENSAPLKSGIGRFEVLLDLFGLGGPIHEDDRRDLFELNQLRNNLVHRSGVADRRLVEACPWLGLKANQRVAIDNSMVTRYRGAATSYATEIIVRLGEFFDVDMSRVTPRSRLPASDKRSRQEWLADQPVNPTQ